MFSSSLSNNLFEIKCAGRWNNNTKELWEIYNDDKINYLKKFKFNICPENINTKNYVTEKIFEAIQADCIPIYYGSNNNPEPEILNKDRIIFWNFNSDNSKNKKMIHNYNIWEDKKNIINGFEQIIEKF